MDILEEIKEYESGEYDGYLYESKRNELIDNLECNNDKNDEIKGITDVFGKTKLVYSKGGDEGGGDYAERVFYFKEYDFYACITGFYSSYEGTDWNGEWSQVSPKQKTITVYN